MNTLSNMVPFLLASASEEGAEKGGHSIGLYIFAFVILTLGIILFILNLAKPGYKDRIFTNKWSQRGEQLYLFLEQFALSIIGPHGKKYMPVLATFWLFIFFSNLVGLFLPYTATAELSTNLGMAIIAIAYVQYEGIKANGLGGHLKHFAGPKMQGALVAISGMIFMIEILSEVMKLASLTLRLYGNIHGGHEVVVAFNKLVGFGGTYTNSHGEAMYNYPILLGGVLIPIKLLTCLVQAMVFCLLLCVYLGLVTHHDHDEEHDEHHGDAHGATLAHA